MAEWDGAERRQDETHVIRAECIKRTAEALAEGRRMEAGVIEMVNGVRGEMGECFRDVSSRVAVLEEQVSGDMGIIKTLKEMQSTLLQMRDSLNKQAWLVPLATAAITTGVVAVVTKLIK
jgi:hypothetical protein